MDSTIALISFALLFLSVAYLSRRPSAAGILLLDRRQSTSSPLKYPHKDPFLGLDLYWLMRNAIGNSKLLEIRKELFEQYGNTLEFNSWGAKVLATREPRNIQTVLSTSFDNFGVEPVREDHTGGSFMAKGIFTADGAIWRRSRALIRPTFARSQIGNFDSLQAHVDRLIDLIPRDGSTRDLQPLFKRLFLDTSTEFLFGESVESLSAQSSFQATSFLQNFDICMGGLASRMQLGRWAFIRGKDVQYREAIAVVYRFIDGHVKRVLQQRGVQQPTQEITSADDGPQSYILLEAMAQETQDPMDLRYQLLHVFFPAHDSTAIAVSDMVFHLARRPDQWSKLRSEILAATSEKSLTFELLKSMKYLRHVINESLRLHPLPDMVRRICHKDTMLPLGGGSDGQSPILVQRGTSLNLNIHALHRDRRAWGDDAESFNPERWEQGRPGWDYLPFSGGPRICPAQQRVFTEAAFILVRFAQRFSSIESRDQEPWTERLRMTVENRNGVKVGLTWAAGAGN